MQKRSLGVRFMAFKILYYSLTTCFSSFILAYLKSVRNVSDSRASLLLMLYTIGAFCGQFFFGRLCDMFRTHKKVFYLLSALVLPVALGLYFTPVFGLICVLYPLFGFCQMPISVIVDTWFLDSFPGNTGLYGKVLAAGACAYAVLSVSYGKLLDSVGYGVMPWFFVGILLLMALVAWKIPDASSASIPHPAHTEKQGHLITGPLALFLLSMLFTGVCGNTYSLLPVLMEHVNGNLTLLGLAMSSSGILQIPFMLLTGRMKRFPARLRVACAGLIYFTMVLCFAFGNSPWYLIFGAGISGAAWGIMLPAYRELVGELADPAYATTAQGLVDATYLSLGSVISSGFVSVTSVNLGLRTPLVIISCVQLTAIFLLIFAHRRHGGKAFQH